MVAVPGLDQFLQTMPPRPWDIPTWLLVWHGCSPPFLGLTGTHHSILSWTFGSSYLSPRLPRTPSLRHSPLTQFIFGWTAMVSTHRRVCFFSGATRFYIHSTVCDCTQHYRLRRILKHAARHAASISAVLALLRAGISRRFSWDVGDLVGRWTHIISRRTNLHYLLNNVRGGRCDSTG